MELEFQVQVTKDTAASTLPHLTLSLALTDEASCYVIKSPHKKKNHMEGPGRHLPVSR